MMKTNRLIQTIEKTVRENNLITPGDSVLIALSGGADSVFLLYALKELSNELDFKISACHVEHGIRGNDSVADMDFCKQLCNRLGVEFYAKAFDVPALAYSEKISVEAAGRQVRYGYFHELMSQFGFSKLATAHHRDDKVETIVMNILRGCGLRGFAGIEYKNRNIIRPLLDVTKSEIQKFLDAYNVSYCVDKTNLDTEYTRNKVRLSLMPELMSFNPSVNENLLRQSTIFTAEDEYLSSVASDALKACERERGLDINKLLSFHVAVGRRVMYMYLASCKGTSLDISFSDVEAALSLCRRGETGKRYSLSGGITVGVDYGIFSVIEWNKIPDFEYSIEFETPVIIKELGIKITIYPQGGNYLIKPGDKIAVRNKRNGDYFYPKGMMGRKKLKDYFADKKIPLYKRSSIPVLTVNGEIAAVLGFRDDRRFCDCGGTCRIVTETI